MQFILCMQFALKCDLRKSQDFMKRNAWYIFFQIDKVIFLKSLKKFYVAKNLREI